jgi:hypothetical protein
MERRKEKEGKWGDTVGSGELRWSKFWAITARILSPVAARCCPAIAAVSRIETGRTICARDLYLEDSIPGYVMCKLADNGIEILIANNYSPIIALEYYTIADNSTEIAKC